ncbi:MAG TPA: hypothetical protein VNC79_07735, partial [Mycobacteriales bacterium]|nr:hypothetical protein [Mycobacteriales bacterium]
MSGFSDALVYLNDPFNWTRPGGILDLLGVHLAISAVAVLAAFVLAFPIGVALGSSGRGGGTVVVVSNVSRAIPTLALLTLFAVSPIGFGPRATTIAPPPRPAVPSAMPTGSAITRAPSTATPDTARCTPSRSMMPLSRV